MGDENKHSPETVPVDTILTPLGLLAIALALAGSYTDVRTRRIPNWLTVGVFALAIVLRLLGAESLGQGFLGAGVAFLVGLAFHIGGMLGAGDVKYLAAFGAILGAGRIWPALALVAIAGGFLALLWTFALGRTVHVLRDSLKLGLHVFSLGFLGSRRILSDVKPDAAVTPIPFGVAIAAGCTLVHFI